jgi:regulatory protein
MTRRMVTVDVRLPREIVRMATSSIRSARETASSTRSYTWSMPPPRPKCVYTSDMEEANIRSGTISAIEPQARHPDRVNVFIDGEFAFGLAATVAVDRGLVKGQMLSDAEVRSLLDAEEAGRATEAAVRLVSYRARSELELRQRLGRRGFSPKAIDLALDKLREWNYLNDREFARQWVESRESHRPRSSGMIKRELTSKGIDAGTAERVVEAAQIDDHGVALDLARKWLPRLRREDRETQRRRLMGYLQRRGFGWDVVRRVLDETLQG